MLRSVSATLCKKCVQFLADQHFQISRGIGAVSLHTKPNFTKNSYEVYRGNYRYLEEWHINQFRNLLGEDRIIMDLCDLEKYNVDTFKHLRGCSQIVLKPRTTEEVSTILSYCNKQNLAVVPQGGHTGVVGGGTPVFDEIVISSELMNQIIDFDEMSGVMVCQSGCILQDLNDVAGDHGFVMPLDLGAKGSCHIGGNVSTNAGGLRLLRYGNIHGNVLGLEAVIADGTILDSLNTLKKDNTGYHLKHLFIGSEGTLGMVTKVAIQCAVKPNAINLAFLGVQSYEKALKTLRKATRDLGEILSAFEIMDAATVQLVSEKLNLHSSIGDYPFYLIVETSGSNPAHDEEKMDEFLRTALLQHYVLNGTATNDTHKMNGIWALRERIPESYTKDGHVFTYDVTLPFQHYYSLVEEMRQYMGDKAHRVFGFGHLGDGNLHLQISARHYSRELVDYLEPHIFKRVKELNGSISAEHGIGFLKKNYLEAVKTPASIGLMRSLKQLMDPKGILNPYKLLI